MISRLAGAIVLLFVAANSLAAQGPPAPTVDSLLLNLIGRWTMTGTVRGSPVTYRMDARPDLKSRWIELHMVETSTPPAYEGRVFIGSDTVPHRVIVHWLDSFGAAYSIPHGTGTTRGDSLVFHFAYPGNPFRDTFTYDRRAKAWRFLIESRQPDGSWRVFADYRVRRRP